MKQYLSWLDANFENVFIGIMLVSITGLSTLQVVMRYCFANALPWVEEVVVYMNVWIGFIGCAFAMKFNNDLRIDFGTLLPPNVAAGMKVLADCVTVAVYLYLAYLGIGIVGDVIHRGQTSPAAGIPLYLLYSSLMVGAALAVFRFAQRTYRTMRRKGNG
ncbi:putative C4-dicarboxylate transport system [uncultured delta proteobacterium]|uniref:Putative C4-dicarboxylate transport system n=1 Tax=uncultured delta proteobacterium TaxID=34034 RepID=A0A212JJJ7_9DELT|nr:putative C4-dicarboxylate transport system [uncultured delta proteobacterium]